MSVEDQAAADAAFTAGYDGQPTETPVEKVEPAKDVKDEPKAGEAAAEPAKEAQPVTLESLLQRIEKFEQGQGKNSDKLFGHIGRLERSYRELQTAQATGQAAAKTVDDAPSQSAIKAAAEDPQEWATLKSQYPEWAAATEKMVAARAPSLDVKAFEDKVYAAIDGKTAEMQSRIIDSSLNAVFPGWRTEVNSDAFKAWMGAQSDEVKALGASDDVGDAARMLKLYDASKTVKPEPSPTPTKPEISAREKRLAAAVTPRGTGGHAGGSTDEDEFTAGYNSR